MGACYYCGKQKENLRRCGQCRIVAYCSQECQKASWKACHKDTCIPNEAIQKGQDADYEEDKRLSKWIEIWRLPVFRMETWALDLGTYPQRNLTHCLLFMLRPRESRQKWKQYEVLDVSVRQYTEVQAMYPELRRIEHKKGPVRLLIVIIVGNRARVASQDDTTVDAMRALPPVMTAIIAKDWRRYLMTLINEEGPTSGTIQALGL